MTVPVILSLMLNPVRDQSGEHVTVVNQLQQVFVGSN